MCLRKGPDARNQRAALSKIDAMLRAKGTLSSRVSISKAIFSLLRRALRGEGSKCKDVILLP